MNLKQGIGFAMLAGIGAALTAGVAAAVAEPGGSGTGTDGTLLSAPEPAFPAQESPFETPGDVLAEGNDPDATTETNGEDDATTGTDSDTQADGPETDGDTPSDAEDPTNSPSPADEPSATPDPSPNGRTPTPDGTTTPEAPFTDGYLPPNWIPSATVACGSPVTDLPDADRDLTTEITGTYQQATGMLPVTITGNTGADDVLGAPILVWSQGGVIVDMGLGWHEADYTVAEALAGQGTWSGTAIAPAFSTCQEETDTTAGMGLQYDNERAPGTYQVRVVTLHTIQQPGSGRIDRLEVSEPTKITVR